MAQNIQDSPLQAVCDQVNKVTAGMPAAAIKAACDAVFVQAQQNPAFTTLQQPPSISGPTSAPTSEPSK
jgi:hypothetical protein